MPVKADFTPGTGLLSVFGDDLDNAVTTSRSAASLILIDGGAVQITGGQPTVANTTLVQVFGQAGADMPVLDESNGALPPAQMLGGAGLDVLDGGPGSSVILQSAVLGQFMASSVAPMSQGPAGAPMADPMSNQPPLPAQPHA